MGNAQIMGDLKPPVPGGAASGRTGSRARRWVIGAFWYAANAGGVVLLYLTRLLG